MSIHYKPLLTQEFREHIAKATRMAATERGFVDSQGELVSDGQAMAIVLGPPLGVPVEVVEKLISQLADTPLGEEVNDMRLINERSAFPGSIDRLREAQVAARAHGVSLHEFDDGP